MAIYKMCSVLDMVAKQFGRPFFAVSDGSAIRGFSDEVNSGSPDSMLSRHPDDFQLFSLGEFDDESGKVSLLDVPMLMVAGSQVRVERADRSPMAVDAGLSAEMADKIRAVKPSRTA